MAKGAKKAFNWYLNDERGQTIATAARTYVTRTAARRGAQRALKQLEAWATAQGYIVAGNYSVTNSNPFGDEPVRVETPKRRRWFGR